MKASNSLPDLDWSQMIPEQDWPLYRTVLEHAHTRGVRFLLGGGMAFSVYARRPRFTKDLDLYVMPSDREAMIQIITESGFEDYYAQLPYDRKWIYRGFRGGAIADVIWSMANERTSTRPEWFDRAPSIRIRGLAIHLLPPEELIWTKLYVLQRDRSDWPDLLNVFVAAGMEIDWGHLLRELGPDRRLLGGVLSTYVWLCPNRAGQLPSWIWEQVGLLPPEGGPDCLEDRARVVLLDSRDWFGPAEAVIEGRAPK